jgi:hypothetical protein
MFPQGPGVAGLVPGGGRKLGHWPCTLEGMLGSQPFLLLLSLLPGCHGGRTLSTVCSRHDGLHPHRPKGSGAQQAHSKTRSRNQPFFLFSPLSQGFCSSEKKIHHLLLKNSPIGKLINPLKLSKL